MAGLLGLTRRAAGAHFVAVRMVAQGSVGEEEEHRQSSFKIEFQRGAQALFGKHNDRETLVSTGRRSSV